MVVYPNPNTNPAMSAILTQSKDNADMSEIDGVFGEASNCGFSVLDTVHQHTDCCQCIDTKLLLLSVSQLLASVIGEQYYIDYYSSVTCYVCGVWGGGFWTGRVDQGV